MEWIAGIWDLLETLKSFLICQCLWKQAKDAGTFGPTVKKSHSWHSNSKMPGEKQHTSRPQNQQRFSWCTLSLLSCADARTQLLYGDTKAWLHWGRGGSVCLCVHTCGHFPVELVSGSGFYPVAQHSSRRRSPKQCQGLGFHGDFKSIPLDHTQILTH